MAALGFDDESSGKQALDDLGAGAAAQGSGNGSMLPSGRLAAALRMTVWVAVSLAWAVMTISGG
jgi:hypothetical protein